VTITVKYSCVPCGLMKVDCEVPARTDSEPVVKWTEEVMAVAIAVDHMMRSPACTATEISEVWVPISGADHIGGVCKQ
jgi:hypothetical protein